MTWFKKPQYTKLDVPKTKDRIPQGLMIKCESCLAMMLKEDLKANLDVCPKCQHHHKISSPRRIEITFDCFEPDNENLAPNDPLGFVDAKPYAEKIKGYQAKTGMNDACVSGVGEIHGFKVAAAIMEFRFAGGSMGSVVGEKVTRAIERGLAEKKPVIAICCSGGARMQEGILSLMQMAKTSAAVARLRDARIPYFVVLTNPTTAGVMASFASLGDIIIAEPKAMIGFAGPRVIEQTIKQILPKGFQTAEFVKDKGFIDIVSHRKDMRETLARCLSFTSGQANPRFPVGPGPDVIDAKDVV
jgi:acetyl-CoA carboxylase carboxyl transferase subunit beta